jgi:putative NADH-flavin reductase
MKLVIFGANGRVGRLIVAEAVRRGHEVTAAVYGDVDARLGDSVRILSVDISEPIQVQHAIHGQDAVVSALGSWGTSTQDIVSRGMKVIVPAMQREGVARLISLTGADARVRGDRPALSAHLMRTILRLAAPKILDDGEVHIRVLRQSDCDWTVIRSPRMIDGGVQEYALSEKSAQAWDKVHRQTIAQAMLDVLEQQTYVRAAPIIHVIA